MVLTPAAILDLHHFTTRPTPCLTPNLAFITPHFPHLSGKVINSYFTIYLYFKPAVAVYAITLWTGQVLGAIWMIFRRLHWPAKAGFIQHIYMCWHWYVHWTQFMSVTDSRDNARWTYPWPEWNQHGRSSIQYSSIDHRHNWTHCLKSYTPIAYLTSTCLSTFVHLYMSRAQFTMHVHAWFFDYVYRKNVTILFSTWQMAEFKGHFFSDNTKPLHMPCMTSNHKMVWLHIYPTTVKDWTTM